MTDFVFAPPATASLSIRDSVQRFAVRRIFCIGRNYAAHVREMGGDPKSAPPVFFTKAAEHVLHGGATMPYPPQTQDFHHEVELVAAVGKSGFRVRADQANELIWGYCCGLDMTRRDLQGLAKKGGAPWDLAKDFEGGAVLGELAPASEIGHPAAGVISLTVNGEERQHADLSDLIWSVPEIVSQLSQYYHLKPGDLIYTGTPEGVGPVGPGDVLQGSVQGVGSVALTVGQPE